MFRLMHCWEQRKWVYLEPIFARGALPNEESRFRRIDEDFSGTGTSLTLSNLFDMKSRRNFLRTVIRHHELRVQGTKALQFGRRPGKLLKDPPRDHILTSPPCYQMYSNLTEKLKAMLDQLERYIKIIHSARCAS